MVFFPESLIFQISYIDALSANKYPARMHPQIIDFHKIKSPFKRAHNERGEYIVTPEMEGEMYAVFHILTL